MQCMYDTYAMCAMSVMCVNKSYLRMFKYVCYVCMYAVSMYGMFQLYGTFVSVYIDVCVYVCMRGMYVCMYVCMLSMYVCM